MKSIIKTPVDGDVTLTSGDDKLIVQKHGSVDGHVDLGGGSHDTLVNQGSIHFNSDGSVGTGAVTAAADHTSVINHGDISADVTIDYGGGAVLGTGSAVQVLAGTLSLGNGNDATLSGGRFGVEITSNANDISIKNHGTISGGDDGIRAHGGEIDNWGTIESTGAFDTNPLGYPWVAADGISSFGIDPSVAIDPDHGLTKIVNHHGGLITGPRSGAFLTNGGTVVNDGTMSGGDGGVGAQGQSEAGIGGAYETVFHVVNHGLIEGTGGGPNGFNGEIPFGVGSLGDVGETSVVNFGTITSVGNGIVSYAGLTLTNQRGGVIEGDSDGDGTGVAIHTSIDENVDLALADMSDNITNKGTIHGDVLLGSGNDLLVNKGTIDGTIDMGTGDDTLVAGRGAEHVVVGAGNDVIEKFDAGTDTLDFSNISGFTDFDAVLAAAHQDGGDVTIDLGDGNSLTLTHTKLSSLSEDDFTYAAAPTGEPVNGTGNDDFFVLGTNYNDGDQIYTGGGGHDTYFVLPNSGNDVVTDFNVTEDSIDLRRVADLTGGGTDGTFTLADLVASDGPDGVVLGLGNGNTLTLEGVSEADLAGANILLPNQVGSNGDDSLTIPDSSQPQFVVGGLGDDTIHAGVSDVYNRIMGGSGDDSIVGGDGFDWIFGGQGNDTIDGGAGYDWVRYVYDPAGVVADFTTGAVTDGWGTTDTVSNVEEFQGSAYGDTVIAAGPIENAYGWDGNDNLSHVGGTHARLWGGAGDDTLTGSSDANGDSWLEGDEGNDLIVANGANTIIFYESSDSGINANFQTGIVQDGFGGTDTVQGYFTGVHGSATGDDVIQLADNGSNGMYVFSRGGNDSLTGSDFTDAFYGGSGDDTIDGGAGEDAVVYYDDTYDSAGPISHGIDANLTTGTVIDGWGNTDTVSNIEDVGGSQFDDTIVGDAGVNNLNGDAGNDIITGGGGGDWLTGGAGADTFVFGANDGSDAISDFNVDEDMIDLTGAGITDTNGDGNVDMLDLTIVDDGSGNALIQLSGGDIDLLGVSIGDLNTDNFTF